MNSSMTLNKIIFAVVIMFILPFLLVIDANAISDSKNGRTISNRYYEDKFEIEVPALPTEYDIVSSNLDDVKIEIKNNKIIISDLVPDQVYNNVKIIFTDNIGRKYEIELDNVITSKPSKADNKFIYDAYTNGLGRKPEHEGFKYWYRRLYSYDITAVDFVMEMISSEEFNNLYETLEEKIRALYRVVVGREADEEGLMYWMIEFTKLIDEFNLSNNQAVLELSKKMMSEGEFKEIVKESGFLYSKW